MKAKQQTASQNEQYNMWQNMTYAYRRVAKVYPNDDCVYDTQHCVVGSSASYQQCASGTGSGND